jgi:DNA-binding transcriptional regulator of glucitol operon
MVITCANVDRGTVFGMSTTQRRGSDALRAGAHRRWALILLVIAAACGCLALGWWQWTRYESASGTFQNLGYALQWPFFAGFCVYAYRKFVRLEAAPPEPRSSTELTEIPDGLLPQRPTSMARDDDDPALREYNAYLAQLNKSDTDKQNRTTA